MEPIQSPRYEPFQDHKNRTVFDTVPPEMYHMVDSYWYKYAPVEPMWYVIIAMIIAVLGIASVSGNFIVIYIFTSTKSLRTPSNLFVVNLAISDFMMMFTMFPPVVLNCYYETWVLGPLICELYGLLGSLFGCVSIWSMTLIAYDRYNVIVKGISRKPLTIGGAVLQLLGVWVFCGLWAVAPMFGWNRYVPEGNMTACGTDYFAKDWWNQSYIIFYGSWCYLVPLAVIVYSYYYILKAVSEHERTMREQAKKMNVGSLRNNDDKNQSVEIKLAKVALCTISLWFVAWTPYTIINLAGIFGFLDLPPLATIAGSIFAKANAVYNPIVYGLSHPKYQAELSKKIPCLSCKKGDTSSAASDAKTQATTEVESTA